MNQGKSIRCGGGGGDGELSVEFRKYFTRAVVLKLRKLLAAWPSSHSRSLGEYRCDHMFLSTCSTSHKTENNARGGCHCFFFSCNTMFSTLPDGKRQKIGGHVMGGYNLTVSECTHKSEQMNRRNPKYNALIIFWGLSGALQGGTRMLAHSTLTVEIRF